MEKIRIKKPKPIPILVLLAIGILVIFLILMVGVILTNMGKGPISTTPTTTTTPPASTPAKSGWKLVDGMREIWENEAGRLVEVGLDTTYREEHRLYGDPRLANLFGRLELWEKKFPEKKLFGATELIWCSINKGMKVCGLRMHYELRPSK